MMPTTRAPDFRRLFESAPNLYLVLDPALVIVAVSDAYCRSTLTKREEILGRGIFDVFPDNPDDAKADGVHNLRASLERVLSLGREDAMPMQKYDIPNPQGGGFEEHYWSPLNSPVFGTDGKVEWIIHRVEDVTEFVRIREQGVSSNALIRKLQDTNAALVARIDENERLRREIEAHLERQKGLLEVSAASEAMAQRLLDASPDTILVLDGHGTILTANQQAAAMYGYPRDELVGMSMASLVPSRLAPIYSTRLRDFAASQSDSIGAGEEFFALRRDGTEFPVDIRVNPHMTASGPTVIVSVRDITDRRAIERQLQQSQKMEAIGNLTGGLAHDFNNLLSVVIGNLDLAKERPSGEPQNDELLDEALSAALRGADLTRRLLAFARRQPLQPITVDLNDLIGNTIKLLSRALPGNITIRQNPDTAVWPVVADPAQLEASIINVMTNARDAMPDGGDLLVSTGNRELDADYASHHAGIRPGDYSLIEISDTGSGMPPEVLAHIFEPFFTTKEEGKGTGLGLSMVFGFMKQSGGHVEAYSEPGLGTTFRLYLPRAAGSGSLETARRVKEQPRAAGQVTETILAVEDNPNLRSLVVRQLNQLGYRCLEAADGPSALKLLEAEPVDLLLSDVIMPGGMSGYELCRQACLRWPNLKVVLTSGFPEEKVGAIASGRPIGTLLLSKPYRKEDLARVVRSALAGHPAEGRAEDASAPVDWTL